MKSIKITFALTLVFIVIMAALPATAEEQAKPVVTEQKVAVHTDVQPKEARDYKIDVNIKGRMPVIDSPEPVSLDAIYSLKIRHTYGKREDDGLMPLEIAVTNMETTVDGQKLTVAPSFPKLTLLIDRQWKVENLFGTAGTRYADPVPGINYVNLITLFYLPDGDKPHAIGESWKTRIKLPGLADVYNFTSTIKSTGELDGVKTATVHQDIVWDPQKLEGDVTAATKAAVDSVFALDTGKLLKSHADCQIVFTSSANKTNSQQESKPQQANIQVDISLPK